MPRKARIDAPGALHHIICRGIERRRIFTTMLTEMILLSGSALFHQTHQRLAMLERLFPITFIFFFEQVQCL
jgi:hypothetical protein